MQSENDRGMEFLESLEDQRLIDPLSEVTRKERKALLGFSLITLAITWGNLVPKEIKAFDIKLDAPEQAGLFLSLSLALVYFLTAFVVYAYSDSIAFRRSRRMLQKRLGILLRPALDLHKEATDARTSEALAAVPGRNRKAAPQKRVNLDKTHESVSLIAQVSDDAHVAGYILLGSKYRAVFDFLIPIAVGVSALNLSLDKFMSFRSNSPEFPWFFLRHPWPLVIVGLCGLVFGVRHLWLHWKKTKPIRRARKTSKQLQAMTDSLREVGDLKPDDPRKKEALKKFMEQLSNLNRDG